MTKERLSDKEYQSMVIQDLYEKTLKKMQLMNDGDLYISMKDLNELMMEYCDDRHNE